MGIADAVSRRSRMRKFRLFMDQLNPTSDTTVLDVGAHELAFGERSKSALENFFEEFYPWPERITALGLHDGSRLRARYPQIQYVQGDGCAIPFDDGAFDIVFSNAVIEHVGGWDRQRLFVSEALRVGRRVFMTTPNRRFPIEVHTKLPFVHWLPKPMEHRVYDSIGKHWATATSLLSASEFESLFPGNVRIVNLRMTLVAIVD